jgi:hypothetical protein
VFGNIAVPWRTYRANGCGKTTALPLDDACGMRGRFVIANVEELAALGMTMLTSAEVGLELEKEAP